MHKHPTYFNKREKVFSLLLRAESILIHIKSIFNVLVGKVEEKTAVEILICCINYAHVFVTS